MKRNRKVGDLIAKVEEALEALDEADEAISHAQEHLTNMQVERTKAVAALAGAREALFKEYPELQGPVVVHQQEAPPDLTKFVTKFEVVEVDDPDDPRYAPGGYIPKPGDIEFQER